MFCSDSGFVRVWRVGCHCGAQQSLLLDRFVAHLQPGLPAGLESRRGDTFQVRFHHCAWY
jgi:hypothetical protein